MNMFRIGQHLPAFYLILISMFLTHCTSRDTIRSRVLQELSSVKGDFAVAFLNLSTGEEVLINERRQFHAASTMKTPVMIEVYKQASEGKLSLYDSVEIRNSFHSIVDGSLFSLDAAGDSSTIFNQIGRKQTLYKLMYDMIIYSSDLSTNLVIEKVGAAQVTATMRSLGAMDIQVLRGVEDNKAYEKGLNNTVTAYDQMLLMSKLAKGEVVSAEASSAMMDILFDQRYREIIPAKLPTDVRVADKRGWIKGLEHDCAVVELPDGRRYVLILLSQNLGDRDQAINAMANVSRMFYDHVVGG